MKRYPLKTFSNSRWMAKKTLSFEKRNDSPIYNKQIRGKRATTWQMERESVFDKRPRRTVQSTHRTTAQVMTVIQSRSTAYKAMFFAVTIELWLHQNISSGGRRAGFPGGCPGGVLLLGLPRQLASDGR